jgi:hypothetical protein
VNCNRLVTALAAVAVLSCADRDTDQAEKISHVVFGEYIQPEDSFPRVRYFDTGQIAPNDRCAVRKVRLNLKMPPVYVNGRPIGFC